MRATAILTVELDASGCGVIRELRSAPPIRLIPHRSAVTDPHGVVVVRVVESAASPIGGDDLSLRVRVEAGARLRLIGTAATLALPGRTGECSRACVEIDVGPMGEVEYLPEATIISARADHRVQTRITLAEDARVRWREIIVLGRHGERPGRLTTTVHLLRSGAPLLRQRLDIHEDRMLASPGYLAGLRVIATETMVWDQHPPEPVSGQWWSLSPLAGGGAVATAVAADAITAQRRLAEATTRQPGCW